MQYSIIHSDILDWATSYDGLLFHAALLDAPYEMEFMGKGWDNTGVAFNPETWRLIARCLHPGAFLFVFAGTINDDLISVAMRQAGLRKYHKAGAWSYGSGFPKAARLDTVIDRRAGVERTKVGTKKHQPKFDAKGFEYRKKDNGYNSKDRATFDVTKPATELAQAWAGHRYGGQVLKPALESILIFQKPYDGSPVSSITATGAGAMNIDLARIPTDEAWQDDGMLTGGRSITDYGDGLNNAGRSGSHPAGRWPANLMLSHSPDCNGDCAPECAVRRLGEQSGEARSAGLYDKGSRYVGAKEGPASFGIDGLISPSYDDTGTAARFFFNADYVAERLEDTDAVIYEAKSSRAEREAGLDPRQVRILGRDDINETLDRSRFYETLTIQFAGRENGSWVFAAQPVTLLVDMATSRPKVIAASMIQELDATAWNMMLFGKGKTELSHLATKSITITKTSLITESKTLDWLTHSLTNAYTADVNYEMRHGGNLAESAAQSNPSITFISNEVIQVPGAATVASETLWIISASDAESFVPGIVDDGRLTPIDNPYLRGMTRRRNLHPTLKPISLARHLATLLLPPAEYAPRRLLVPFSGAGSEMIGALLAGWDKIVGVELEADHCRIAEARLAYWQQRKHEFLDPSKPITAALNEATDDQLELF